MDKDLLYYTIYYNPSLSERSGCGHKRAYYVHKRVLFVNSKYRRPGKLIGIEEIFIPLSDEINSMIDNSYIEIFSRNVEEIKKSENRFGYIFFGDLSNRERFAQIDELTYDKIKNFIENKKWDELFLLLKTIINPN